MQISTIIVLLVQRTVLPRQSSLNLPACTQLHINNMSPFLATISSSRENSAKKTMQEFNILQGNNGDAATSSDELCEVLCESSAYESLRGCGLCPPCLR